tara:strand:- start:260 stop:448 length:189 start_codon:yes stop_codon:yes gene_type:complete
MTFPWPFDAAPQLITHTVQLFGYGLPGGHVWLSLLFFSFVACYYSNTKMLVFAIIWVMLIAI